MVLVTPRAMKHLSGIRSERGFGRTIGARFVLRGSGIGLTFLSEPKPDDSVIKGYDLLIYFAREVAEKLDGSEIDVAEDDGKKKLVLRQGGAAGADSSRPRNRPAGGAPR